jgi:hypothetical protein
VRLADRVHRWNCWYDRLPPEWRFQVVLWPLVAIGAINMALTVAHWFPFGLLVLIGILVFAAMRASYVLGWIVPAEGPRSAEAGDLRLEIAGADWLVDLNRRYDAMPEPRRFWVFPLILLVAGALNMLLTIWVGFPFGLIFLLALVAVVAVRAPYTVGLLKSSSSEGSAIDDRHNPIIEHAPSAGIALEPHLADPALPTQPDLSPAMSGLDPDITHTAPILAEPQPPDRTEGTGIYPSPSDGSRFGTAEESQEGPQANEAVRRSRRRPPNT